jgi:putative ABC transport system permease protein
MVGSGFFETDRLPGSRAAMISSALWKAQFAGDPDVVGNPIVVNGDTYTIRGVMAPGFFFPDVDARLWLALADDFPGAKDRGVPLVEGVGRLRPRLTAAGTQRELAGLSAALAKQFPSTDANLGPTVTELRRVVVENYSQAFWILAGAVFLLLTMACLDAVLLLAARSIERRRETAIASALGAPRSTAVATALVEHLVLSAVTAVAGILFAFAVLKVVGVSGVNIPHLDKARLESPVLLLGIGLSLAANVLVPVLTALRATRRNVSSLLGPSYELTLGPLDGIFSYSVLAAQVAVAVVLVIGTGLLTKSFANIAKAQWGFRPEQVLAIDVELPKIMARQMEQQNEFVTRTLARLTHTPGINGTAMAFGIPGAWEHFTPTFVLVGRRVITDNWTAHAWVVSPGYFRTMGIPVRAGREFVHADDGLENIVLVNEALAKRLRPDGNPIGEAIGIVQIRRVGGRVPKSVVDRLRNHDDTLFQDLSVWENVERPARIVAGVVGNVRMFGLDRDPEPSIYLDYRHPLPSQAAVGSLSPKFVIWSSLPPSDVAKMAKDTIRSVQPDASTSRIYSMEEVVDASVGGRGSTRLLALLFVLFGSSALWVAAIGTHSVANHSVVVRKREVGVRLCLGANRSAIARLFARRAGLALAAGWLVGLLAYGVLARSLRAYLFGVVANDLVMMAAAVAITAMTSALAYALPLYRATRIDPALTLRAE